MLRNTILTVDNLKKRGWQMTNVCHMCYNTEETLHHLFTDYQYIKEVRYYIDDVIQNYRSVNTNYRSGRYQFILDIAQEKHWKKIKIVTLSFGVKDVCEYSVKRIRHF
jgi:zinc-binding in reverse transcriptase